MSEHDGTSLLGGVSPADQQDARVRPSVAARATKTTLDKLRDTALWLRESGLSTLGYVVLAVVVTAGWTASFIGLHDFARGHMGFSDDQAWLVPTAFDAGALGMSIGVARAAMHGRTSPLSRLMVVAFTALSSWINWLHISDGLGRWIAALLPVAAVVVFESLMAEARKAYERRTKEPRPRLSLLRWLFDFSGTHEILRAYVLGLPLPEQMALAAEQLAAEPHEADDPVDVPPAPEPTPPTQAPPVPPTAPAEPPAAAPTLPQRRPADLVSIEHETGRPDWVTPDMAPSEAMRAYLDRHGDTRGAVLDRWANDLGLDFKSGLGRTVLARWKSSRDDERDAGRDTGRDSHARPVAVGEA